MVQYSSLQLVEHMNPILLNCEYLICFVLTFFHCFVSLKKSLTSLQTPVPTPPPAPASCRVNPDSQTPVLPAWPPLVTDEAVCELMLTTDEEWRQYSLARRETAASLHCPDQQFAPGSLSTVHTAAEIQNCELLVKLLLCCCLTLMNLQTCFPLTCVRLRVLLCLQRAPSLL